MRNKNFLLTGIALTISPLITVVNARNETEKPKNILFIAIDDFRPAIGYYGDPLAKTPNIDKLASQGITFTNHYVQAASSGPSRTSMLTGLRPDQVKVTDHATHFRNTVPDVITMPQFFKNNGYTAISIGKIFHYSSGYDDPVSWDSQYFLKGDGVGYALPENKKKGKGIEGKGAAFECAPVNDTVYTDGKITTKAIEYLKSFKNSKTPFFLGVGHLKPHLPFNAPKQYWDLYNRESFREIKDRNKPENAPEIAFHQWQELRGYADIPDNGPLTPDMEMTLRHAYYACVSYVDAQIGKLLATLDELGLRENTIIVLWGDHGYHLGEQNIWCKSTNFEMSARSPLIIASSDLNNKGAKCDALVESVDIYPTILDLTNQDKNPTHTGNSLKPFLYNVGKKWDKPAFNQFARPYKAAIGGKDPKSHMGYSVRLDNWRYTVWFNYTTNAYEFPELYDISSAGPTLNIAGKPDLKAIETKLHQLILDYHKGKVNYSSENKDKQGKKDKVGKKENKGKKKKAKKSNDNE
jgi:iduronate 2-sulfatase